MATSAGQPNHTYVYLRVPKSLWNKEKGEPKPDAFFLRTTQTMLSVYRADMQTPRGVLQCCIDGQKERSADPDPAKQSKARQFLSQYGTTVEELVEKGWRIVRLPASAFTDRLFEILPPDPDGHQNVKGAREDFMAYADELVTCCQVLTPEQCLAKP